MLSRFCHPCQVDVRHPAVLAVRLVLCLLLSMPGTAFSASWFEETQGQSESRNEAEEERGDALVTSGMRRRQKQHALSAPPHNTLSPLDRLLVSYVSARWAASTDRDCWSCPLRC